MLVMQVAEHRPEVCPVYNDEYKSVTLKWFESVDRLCAKSGIKMLGFWTDHPAHRVFMLYDTPSMDAMMGMSMQPEVVAMLAFQTIKTFPVLDFKQTWDIIKH